MQWNPRLLNIAKWAGTTVAFLLVVAYSVSLFKEVGYNDLNRSISIETGSLYFSFLRGGEPDMLYVDRFPGQQGWVAFASFGPQYILPHITRWRAPTFPDPTMRYWTVIIPLWLPFILVAIPTLLIWQRDLNRPRRGHCPNCHYNLTGNTTGICSECGAPIPREKREILSAATTTPPNG